MAPASSGLAALPLLIALVPNSGSGVGMGHLERQLALADALADRAETVIVTGPDGPEAERVRARGHQQRAAQGSWPHRAAEAIAALAPAVAVLDGYGLDLAVQVNLRRRASLVVVDDTNGPCDCDILVNPAPGGSDLDVPGRADHVLAGADYALLSDDYAKAREAREQDGFDPRAVAVVTGGADVGQLQADLIKFLREAIPNAELRVAVGPRGSAPMPAAGVVVHTAPPTLALVLARSALYVGTAGGSAVQAACVGVPAVVLCAAENQARQAAALADAGCAVALPPGAGASEAAGAARAILSNEARSQAMSAAGRRLVDGRGSERVAAAILELALAGRAL